MGTAEINIGETKKSEYILDEQGKKKEFGSVAAFITYMSKRGWEYVEKIDEYRFILKKEVTNDEQAREHLNLKQTPK